MGLTAGAMIAALFGMNVRVYRLSLSLSLLDLLKLI